MFLISYSLICIFSRAYMVDLTHNFPTSFLYIVYIYLRCTQTMQATLFTSYFENIKKEGFLNYNLVRKEAWFSNIMDITLAALATYFQYGSMSSNSKSHPRAEM